MTFIQKKNFKVIVIDNLSGGNIKNIKQHLKNKDFNLKKIDITKSINTRTPKAKRNC